MSRILDALADIDRKRDATEQRLRDEIRSLEKQNRYLTEQWQESTALLSRRTLAIAPMIAHLSGLGMSREEIEKLTMGNLDLGDETGKET